MSDLISRQEVIEHLKKRLYETALNNYPDYSYYEEIADNRVDTWLNELPSAKPNLQPTCNQLATDCISRQKAIDAFMTATSDGDKAEWCKWMLEQLPSAQPETAKRIVGKSRNGMTLWYQCDMCNEPVDAQDNFCRGCGRRLTDG